MTFPNKDYLHDPVGIAKCIALAVSSGLLFLTTISKPTELQEEIVESIWKEYSLYYHSMVGILITLLSLGICLVFINVSINPWYRVFELIIFTIAGLNFLIFGSAMLESTLTIFTRIKSCCGELHLEKNVTCNLPGFDEAYDEFQGRNQMLEHYLLPDIAECDKEIDFDSWRCARCINKAIQPMFEWKGAAGAVGLITSIAFLIVSFVIVRGFILKGPRDSRLNRTMK